MFVNSWVSSPWIMDHKTKTCYHLSVLYLLRIGTWSWSALNTALLHSAAIRAKAFHVSDDYIKNNLSISQDKAKTILDLKKQSPLMLIKPAYSILRFKTLFIVKQLLLQSYQLTISALCY